MDRAWILTCRWPTQTPRHLSKRTSPWPESSWLLTYIRPLWSIKSGQHPPVTHLGAVGRCSQSPRRSWRSSSFRIRLGPFILSRLNVKSLCHHWWGKSWWGQGRPNLMVGTALGLWPRQRICCTFPRLVGGSRSSRLLLRWFPGCKAKTHHIFCRGLR